MNRDQLRIALGRAVERHARTLQDQGGRAGPGLLDDLERIADEHAVQHAGKVAARRELRAEAAAPVAASTETTGPSLSADPPRSTGGATVAEVTMVPQSSARTRTRPRRSTG